MSAILFHHHRGSRRTLRLQLCLLTVCVSLVGAAGAAWLGLSFVGVVGGDVRVDARLTTVGDSLGTNSDVKFRGLRVGRVVTVEHGDTPHAQLILSDEHAAHIPADVRARVLPGTLFGNEYVDLVPAAGRGVSPRGQSLRTGDVIEPDTSAPTIRLMETVEATQRLLSAMDPARLSTAISQLADALDGRGAALAQFLTDADRYLADWARLEPQVFEDLELLAENVTVLADVEPQLVQALRSSLPTARALVERRQQVERLMRGSRALMTSVRGFLDRQADQLATLTEATAATLAVFAARHPAFEELLGGLPTLLRNGAAAIRGNAIQMEAVFGSQLVSPYSPQDCPRYGSLAGPNCPGP